ncbi:hypothetical protein GGH19_003118 [Coemansia sp. RSA 1807]|nr:hypothetical protein LPJ54_002419 [Coemansia sp. RSA 1824]KAJ1785708.1 hypothetical protein LPJ62_004111 [Coemansia sp. RSA 2167]KAJ2131580.1 hypothetical protein GGH17_003473 [Coemansia sp. RSA 788]KAJ2143339.1 hypothetical protein IW142_003784 [Coemansia sp. RSA 564]KAJ2145759.1 hypothetical protein J3F82_004974 [Coemansia sp. RSA 637]KAJ2177766.1 hypothetical protein EV181_006429 [Coemansia sp. RSA 532]KAJ2192714.1 hypothetical protein IW145_006619 [Coemansia sp. RSA 521]KAJ2193502.1 h
MTESVAKTTDTGVQTASLTRVSGRPWKSLKKPTNRTMMAKSLRRSHEQRMQQDRDQKSLKLMEKELRDEKEAEKTALRNRIVERRKKFQEKVQREAFEAKMSERKRMRMKRKELRQRAHAKH